MTDYPNALPKEYRLHEYEIVRVLGVGGFGVTYLAFDHHLDKAVAIKEYLPNDLAVRVDGTSVHPKSSFDREDFQWGLDRFLDEARTLARFDHPSIIRVIRFFETNDTAYIVMEYAEGETLAAHLRDHGPLNEDELKGILLPLIDGLEKVHQADLLHRDIKPDNIILRHERSPVLIDFGAARQRVVARSRGVSAIISVGFSPYEQYSTNKKQGAWTDIYALGAVCHVALTGEKPPAAVDRVPEDRYTPLVKKASGRASEHFLEAVDMALGVFEGSRPQDLTQWRAALEGEGQSVPDQVPASSAQTVEKSREGDRDPPEAVPDKPSTESRVSNVQKTSEPGRKGRYLLSALLLVIAIASIWAFWPDPDSTTAEEAPVAEEQEHPGRDQEGGEVRRRELITNIQAELNRLGRDVPVDGVAGQGTTDQIRAFERASGQAESGEATESLLAALQASPRWPGESRVSITKLSDLLGMQSDLTMDELEIAFELGRVQNVIAGGRARWAEEQEPFALYAMGKAYLVSGAVDKGKSYLSRAVKAGEHRAECLILVADMYSEATHRLYYEEDNQAYRDMRDESNEKQEDCQKSVTQRLLTSDHQSSQERFEVANALFDGALREVVEWGGEVRPHSMNVVTSFCAAENWWFCGKLLWEDIEFDNRDDYRRRLLDAAREGDLVALMHIDIDGIWGRLLSGSEARGMWAEGGFVGEMVGQAKAAYRSGMEQQAAKWLSQSVSSAGPATLLDALAFVEFGTEGFDVELNIRDRLKQVFNWGEERINLELGCRASGYPGVSRTGGGGSSTTNTSASDERAVATGARLCLSQFLYL